MNANMTSVIYGFEFDGRQTHINIAITICYTNLAANRSTNVQHVLLRCHVHNNALNGMKMQLQDFSI